MLYTEFRTRPSIQNLPDPEPPDHGVVVEVKASGVCRSDWHGWMGHDPDIALPHVPGHELAGVVVETGDMVERWRVGDRVTVPFVAGCGACPECGSGNQQVCPNQSQPGFTKWGSFAEHVALDYADENLVAVPDSMAFTTAAGLGCRFATSFRAVVDQAETNPGEFVVVHGCGGVGLSAVMIAVALGARVVAVDIDTDRLDFASEIGAEVTIDTTRLSADEVVSAVRDLTGGGAHVSIDAFGSAATCHNSIANLRRRGRHIQVGLMTGHDAETSVPFDLVISGELRVMGSHGMPAHRYPAMLKMIEDGRLAPDRLVRRCVSLDESVEVLVTMDQFDGTGVTVIDTFHLDQAGPDAG